MGSVVSYPPRGRWLPVEYQALGSLQRVLGEYCPHEYQRGIAEDGTPWAAFYHSQTGELIARITRSKRGYVLSCRDCRREAVRLEQLAGTLLLEGLSVADRPLM
jgi:hypothetical protein